MQVAAVKAPPGIGAKIAIKYRITAQNDRNSVAIVINGTNKATLVVKDTEVGELPKAGSTGIYPYIGVATALMSGAMVITVVTTKRRKALA